MRPEIPLDDPMFLSERLSELARDVRRLLLGLCADLADRYAAPAATLGLPVDYLRWLADVVKPEDWAGWKLVGWVEELNDLVYFIDLREHWRREQDRHAFAEALLADCEEQFYENSYQEELFPSGEPDPTGLGWRLDALCARLAQGVVEESLFLAPGAPCAWLASGRRRRDDEWVVPCSLAPNFERAERGGCLAVGLEGARLEPPGPLRRLLSGTAARLSLVIRPQGIRLRAGRRLVPILTLDEGLRWHWRVVAPRRIGLEGLTLGDTLVYRKDGTPARLAPTPAGLLDRVRRALAVIEAAWPAGARTLVILTTRIVPIKARGVVSFSYRLVPGCRSSIASIGISSTSWTISYTRTAITI